MARFYLMIKSLGAVPERVELDAVDRDHALYLAERYSRDADVELWDGSNLLAEMSRTTPHLWMVRPCNGASFGSGRVEGAGTAGDGIAAGHG